MKLNRVFALAGISTALLTVSCSTKAVDYQNNLDKYVIEEDFHEDYEVLQLTDIHWSSGTQRAAQEKYIKGLLEEVENHIGKKVDLITITGDLFMLSNKETAKSFISFMEDLDRPYAPIWGNHDREGTYNPNWLTRQFLKAENCVYAEFDDNVFNRSNYVINLMDGSDVRWQLAMLDSGADIHESAASPFLTYDYIRESQFDWFTAEHKLAGDDVPVITYYHIAQQEYDRAYDEVQAGATYKNKFFKYESFACSEAEAVVGTYEWFDTMKANNVKASFIGHAHSNDWCCDYDGITLGMGVKTGTELYYAKVSEEDAKAQGIVDADGNGIAFDLTGASLVTLNSDSTFDLEHVYYSTGKDAIWLTY